MDLSRLDVLELMRLNQETLAELEKREIIRTRNNPVSEYTEWLVSTKLNMMLANASTKGYDATSETGRKIQIKSRKNNIKNRSMVLGIIRNYELNQFDELIAVIFHDDFSIRHALEIPHELVKEYGFYNEHQNGYTLSISSALLSDSRVKDIGVLLGKQEIEHLNLHIENEEEIKSGAERELQTVGMTTFIEYYSYSYQGIKVTDLVEIMVRDHPEWKEITVRTKASTMNRIFKREMNRDCLSLILKSKNSAIIDSVRDQARRYLEMSKLA